ncbi:hypothetical protein BCR41DRAFT_393667 [Lobosporangium transversale]|uniref:Uncharacterized protein n=1 Tax=Lobosporangium transversale TaxID=64571 RepID=A0A1Y2GW36_9FUNG|nr:hypothetical protein BCR41DRAFT_393667 [Lobosporangium transversale]ORZ26479.1 hypothetical protein BCR41DRAFT_393667 [Lobosporangium transversale]|eukprot:XP_021884244.1 hypothetical protein BCR41DRAFT_393667 [Lobosporangium transversale]
MGGEAWSPNTDFGIVRKIILSDLSADDTGPDSLIMEMASINDGVAVAKFETPSIPVKTKGNILESTVDTTDLRVMPGQKDNFSGFIEDLMSSESSDADPSMTLTATNIGISSSITLRSMDYLSQMVHLGLVSLAKNADLDLVGVTNIPKLHLIMGDNVVTATTTFTDPDAYEHP